MASTTTSEHGARAFLDAIRSGDFDALTDVSTDDLSWWWPSTLPYGGLTEGRAAVIDGVLRPASELYEPGSMTLTVTNEHVADELALYELAIAGRSAAGQPYENFALLLLRLRDGLVCAVNEYSDTQQTAEYLLGDRAFRDAPSTTFSPAAQAGS